MNSPDANILIIPLSSFRVNGFFLAFLRSKKMWGYSMEIRRAVGNDIDLLVENRLEFVCSIRSIPNLDEFKIHTRIYLQEHMEDDSFLYYIAIEEGIIIASCLLCIYETVPIPSCLNGKSGLLLNVYTLKEHRRKGLSFALLTKMIEEAKQIGVGKILLTYTDDGYRLYQKLGFEKLEKEMVLKLT